LHQLTEGISRVDYNNLENSKIQVNTPKGNEISLLADTFNGMLDQLDQSAKEVKDSEEKWKSLTENSPDHILLLDIDYTILFVNRTAPDIPKERVIGKPLSELIPIDDYQRAVECFKRILLSGTADQYESKHTTTKGDTRYFDVNISPLKGNDHHIYGFISTSRNITVKKQNEMALRRAKKMDAVGQMAGGIAHDFNNILGIILGNVNLLKHHIQNNGQALKRVETIRIKPYLTLFITTWSLE